MRFSGLMLDSARCLENRAYYRQIIEFVAERGINTLLWHFTDDQGCTLKFDSVAGIASPNAYSKEEMKELIAFAKEWGITIIPELASLGHTRYLTKLPQFRHLDEIENIFTGMCPVATETRTVLAALIDEVADVFDSPWIHCGLDEANIGHHPLTREALQTRTKAELVVDHITFMHGLVKRHGRSMMIWGDGLLHDRDIAPRISRDIIICDWQYGADVNGDTVRYFLDEGFSLVLCPALISYNQPTFPGDQLAISNLRSILRHQSLTGSGRILGVIETIWQPERYMHDSLWIGIDLATRMLREGPGVSIEDCTRQFAAEFYGMHASETWIAAIREMYRIAPLRKEWLAVAKLESDKLPSLADLTTRARAWRHIAGEVAAAEGEVQQNRRAYGTFALLVNVISHLYTRAEAFLAGRIDTRTWTGYFELETQLLADVDAVWNRERFEDDPKKYAPAREVMRENHLIIVLRAVLEKTERMLSQTKIAAAAHRSSPPADALSAAATGQP